MDLFCIDFILDIDYCLAQHLVESARGHGLKARLLYGCTQSHLVDEGLRACGHAQAGMYGEKHVY